MIACPCCGSPPSPGPGALVEPRSGMCLCDRLAAWDAPRRCLRFLTGVPGCRVRLEAGPDGCWLEDGPGGARVPLDEARAREVAESARLHLLARMVLQS